MFSIRAFHSLMASFAAALLLVACGGGTVVGDGSPLLQFNASSPSSSVLASSAKPVQMATTPTVSAAELFDWAETNYPQFFPTHQSNQAFDIYTFRYYPSTGNYVGLTNAGIVVGLGSYTGGEIVQFGALGNFACSVKPNDPACTGGGGGGTTTAGDLNECTDANSGALTTGYTSHIVFTYSGIITGEQTVDTVVNGAATFEGQNAVKVTATTTGTNSVVTNGLTVTTPIDTVNKIYMQVVGTTKPALTLGDESVANVTVSVPFVGSMTTSTALKVVYNPAYQDATFTLALGETKTQSINQTTTTTITTPFGGAGQASTTSGTFSTTVKYAAKETISVQGKSYNTCKYETSDPAGGSGSTTWYIQGKGIPVKTQTVTTGGTQTVEMKSGTVNGVAL